MKRFIKGILISLILALIFVIGAPIIESHYDLATLPNAYAQEEADPETNEEPKSVQAILEDYKEPASETPQTVKNKEDFTNQVARLANLSHRLFAPFINFFAFQIGNFLGIDYIYSGPMGDMLHKIWVISRNLVNISFVFILLWLALKEIFYVTQESELKGNLIKFALLLVAVNFSWLGTKVVLDAANVVTHAVFAIPSGISTPASMDQCKVNTSDPSKPFTGACYPTAIIAPANSSANSPFYWEDGEGENDHCADVKKAYSGETNSAYTADGEINKDASPSNKKLQGRTSFCMENLNLVKYDQNTAVIYLTYGMARVQNLIASGASADIDDLAVGVLLSLLIQLAYTVALLALFIALIARMAMLWFFVAFSPFLVLVIWFKGAEDYDTGENFKFGYNEFINYAFAPAYVGAIFAVTFIMISAGQGAGEVTSTLFDNVNAKSGVAVSIPEVRSLFGSIGSLQTFIWLLMSLVVLWMGTFAMISKITIIKSVTDKIKSAGTEAAKLVGTSPYWAPILPLGQGGEKQSIQSVWKGVSPLGKLQKAYDESRGSEQDIRSFQSKVNGMDNNKLDTIARILREGNANKSQANNFAVKMGFRDSEQLINNKTAFVNGVDGITGVESGTGTKLYDYVVAASKKSGGSDLPPATAPVPEKKPEPPTNEAPSQPAQ